MKKHTIELYSFSELSEEAKAVAIEKHRDINVDYEWHEETVNTFVAETEAMGYEDVEVFFSGFGSQGDGACFTAKSIDVAKLLETMSGLTGDALNRKWGRVIRAYHGGDIEANIKHTWRYYYASSTDVSFDYLGSDEKTNELVGEAMMETMTHREKLGDKLYRELQTEYFERISDSEVAESLEANDYDFRKDGTIFHA